MRSNVCTVIKPRLQGVGVGVDVGVVAGAGVAAKVSTSDGLGRLSSELLALCEATFRAVGNIEADRHGLGPEIRSLRLTASLSMTPSLKNRPEVLAELRKVRNLCTGRLARSESLVPLGVADDRYRTDVCQGNEDAATYSRPGLAFLLHAQDVHARPPKGGVTPCFRIFESPHPSTGAMMPGSEWLILSYI
eukprot:jgi/Tetstr1/464829/TSEL_009568.t1